MVSRFLMPSLAAAVVTSTVVGVSVATSPDVTAVGDRSAFSAHLIQNADPLEAADKFADREQRVSRAAPRTTLVDLPEPVGHRFATAPLKLRLEPAEKAEDAGVVDVLSKLFITGERKDGYTQILLEDKLFWVSSEYLAKKKPEPEVSAAGGAGALPVGECTAAPPSGVTASAMAVYEAVCARFPQVTTYGGWRGDGEHSDGRAIDIMVSGELGWDIANYLLANAGTFGLYDIIYAQRIWTDERSSEGWRYMEDRGSTTANHYDHVHVKVY